MLQVEIIDLDLNLEHERDIQGVNIQVRPSTAEVHEPKPSTSNYSEILVMLKRAVKAKPGRKTPTDFILTSDEVIMKKQAAQALKKEKEEKKVLAKNEKARKMALAKSEKERKKVATKGKKTTKKSANVDKENHDPVRCLYCDEMCIEPVTEDWIMCFKCKRWCHESCSGTKSKAPKRFHCHDCK
jgi:preprotein translocase subunit SecD